MPSRRSQLLIQLARSLARNLGWRDDHRVSAVWIIGSVATGSDDPRSDLDLIVVSNSPPADDERLAAYRRVGSSKAMVGFFQKDSPSLPANVHAIDKIWLQGKQVDICYATKQQAAVYNFQPHIAVKAASGVTIAPLESPHRRPVEQMTNRLRYDLRILTIHRERYKRWCARRRWLSVDLSAFLLAARDIVLVLNGYWRYNSPNPFTWELLKNLHVVPPNLLRRFEDIRQIDDRKFSAEKLSLIDSVILDLRKLCESENIRPKLYDIGDE